MIVFPGKRVSDRSYQKSKDLDTRWEYFSLHVATRCNISCNICWLFPIKQDIAKLAKPKIGKYVEEELGFLVLDTLKFVACNVAKVEQDSTSAILRATISGVESHDAI